MTIPLLTVNLRNKRDLLTARQRARQVAGLLGCDERESAAVAAAVFEVACTASLRPRPRFLHFELAANVLQVFPSEPPAPVPAACGASGKWDRAAVRRLLHRLRRKPPVMKGMLARLDYRLPARDRTVAAHDLPLVIRTLAQMIPPDPFEEIQRQNQEMLLVCRERVGDTARRGRPAA